MASGMSGTPTSLRKGNLIMLVPVPLGGEVKGQLQVRGKEATRKGGDTVCRSRRKGRNLSNKHAGLASLHSAPELRSTLG